MIYVWIIGFCLQFFFIISKRAALYRSKYLFFFAKLWLFLSELELSRTELSKLLQLFSWKIVIIPFILFYQFFFLYDLACKAWILEKFIFELEASHGFKITCILVSQETSLKRNGGVISKTYWLILWSYLYSFSRCININENGKYLNHSKLSYRNSHISVKVSDRRLLVLVLDWILVYTISNMWMNCLYDQT